MKIDNLANQFTLKILFYTLNEFSESHLSAEKHNFEKMWQYIVSLAETVLKVESNMLGNALLLCKICWDIIVKSAKQTRISG